MPSKNQILVLLNHPPLQVFPQGELLALYLARQKKQSVLLVREKPQASIAAAAAERFLCSLPASFLGWGPALVKGYFPRHPLSVAVETAYVFPESGAETFNLNLSEVLGRLRKEYQRVIIEVEYKNEEWLEPLLQQADKVCAVFDKDKKPQFKMYSGSFKSRFKSEPQGIFWSDEDQLSVVEDGFVLPKSLAVKLKGEGVAAGVEDSSLRQFFDFIAGVEDRASVPASKSTLTNDTSRVVFKRQVHEKLLKKMDVKHLEWELTQAPGRAEEFKKRLQDEIEAILRDERQSFTEAEKVLFLREMMDDVLGLGPLEDLLRDPEVTEIMVNHKDQIFVEKQGKLSATDKRFLSDHQLMAVIEKIVAPLGRRIDESTPYVDARLKDGSRVNAIIPPLALRGPCLTIRKFSKERLRMEDLVRFGSLTPAAAEFLALCVLNRRNMVISGGTGSGKTTLLNVLSSSIPEKERIVTIEDSAELNLSQPHVVSLESRPPNIEGRGTVTIRDLVRNALRMRPDRIVVGECRGGEALDMLQAMNTGHDGSLTTAHANTPRDCLSRLETMVLMAGMDLPVRAIREQVVGAVHLIIQQSRMSDGTRKVTQITEVGGMEGDKITLQDVFIFEQKGFDGQGKVLGVLKPTGLIPRFVEDLTKRGIKVDRGMFA